MTSPLPACLATLLLVSVIAVGPARGADGDIRNNLLDLLRKTHESQDATKQLAPKKASERPKTRVLHLKKIEDVDLAPPPPKPAATVRRRDFDRLPDHGKGRGSWAPFKGNGRVAPGPNREEWAWFNYRWGKIHVRWRGADTPAWGKVGRGTQPVISHVVLPITKETVYTYYDTTKSIVISFHVKRNEQFIDGEWRDMADSMDRSQFPILAKYYYENLAPYAQARTATNPGTTPRRGSGNASRSTPPRSRATKDPPLLGQ